jgi:hypothetical protein
MSVMLICPDSARSDPKRGRGKGGERRGGQKEKEEEKTRNDQTWIPVPKNMFTKPSMKI